MKKIALISISPSSQFPNTGLDQICNWVRKNGHYVIMKYYHNNEKIKNIVNELLLLDVSYYGFSTSALNILDIQFICKEIKRKKENAKIIIGGAFSTLYYKEILEDTPDIDYIILGNGEDIMLYILEQESMVAANEHIVTRNKLKNKNPVIPYHQNICDKHKPAEDFYLEYRNPLTIYTLASKNNICTGNCSFCCERKHGAMMYRPAEDLVSEILDIHHRHNIIRFFFIDDDLLDPNDTVARNRIVQLCDLLIASGKHLLLQCYTKTNNFRDGDQLLLRKMAKAGFVSLFIGVESGNEDDLKLYQKQCTLQDNYNAIQYIQDAGIYPLVGFIGFHPYSTRERLAKNFNFLIYNKITELAYYVDTELTLYKGTKLTEMIERDQLLCDDYSYKNLSAYRYQSKEVQEIRDYLATYRHLSRIDDFSLIYHILIKNVNVSKYEERFEQLETATLELINIFFSPLYMHGDIQYCEKNRKEFETTYMDLERKKEILLNRLIALNMKA